MTTKSLQKPLIVAITLSFSLFFLVLNSFSTKAKQEKLVRVGKCAEIWQETKVDANDKDNVKWYIYAGNRCDESITFDRSLKITRAKNITVVQGDVFDLHQMIIPERDRKVVMIIMKVQPFNKAQFSWKIVR